MKCIPEDNLSLRDALFYEIYWKFLGLNNDNSGIFKM